MANQAQMASWQPTLGTRTRAGRGVDFRVWAPHAKELCVRAAESRQLIPAVLQDGIFTATAAGMTAGDDYSLVLNGGQDRPDPLSRWQPHGVHGPSRVVDPSAFHWSDSAWQGIDLQQFVIYELHTGTFTPEGTFESIIPKLPYLRELGVTAVELMPVAEFPGERNWGYDGVGLYAPQSSYGGPDGLKRLVDACHREGLAVVLDVVYNHLGPEGNYLSEFGPYFTDSYRTPWGKALNFDGPDSDEVRRFFVDNALYWLTEYHVDALRLDAIHGIYDFGARHILAELTYEFHAQARRLGRKAWVIAESDLNDTRVIGQRSEGGHAVDAQWHDDFHHSLHTVLTEASRGYLADFGKLADLRKAIVEGFVYDGNLSSYRRRRHGSSSKEQPGHRFVACNQNHDQIANTSQGSRLSQLVSREQQKLGAAVLLFAPFLPMLFMGQEFGETSPFLYFTSHGDPDLARAVSEGRRNEFAEFADLRDFSDPQAPETFQHSKLSWHLLDEEENQALLRFHCACLALRKQTPALANCRKDLTRVNVSEEERWLVLERGDAGESRALLACNFGAHEQTVPVGEFYTAGMKLRLWTLASEFGSQGQAGAPPQRLDNLRNLTLAGFGAALYTR